MCVALLSLTVLVQGQTTVATETYSLLTYRANENSVVAATAVTTDTVPSTNSVTTAADTSAVAVAK